jgi:UDP-3-O-[3-hydroxymyristoyl] glucosamine N-acyltransferase
LNKRPRLLRDLADEVGGSLEGDPGKPIVGIAPLEKAGAEEITFLSNPRYRQQALESRPGAILAAPGVDLPGLDVIRVRDPYLGMARLLSLFHPAADPSPGVRDGAKVEGSSRVDPSAAVLAGAYVGERTSVGPGTILHPGVVVGEDCVVGSECILHPNVTVYPRSRVGDRVILHAGVVLGSDGFGFAQDDGVHVKIPQVGNVIIEDDVEIGANSTVDRATFGSTVIGIGTKIDNLVQIGHNVVVGPGCILVAQAGIAGSTKLGRGVVIAGQSGAVGHITIGDGAKIGAKSAVTHDLPPGAFVIGHPAVDAKTWKRAAAAFARLPEMVRRLTRLERGAGGGRKKER